MPTIYEVAALAGVSPKTAARILAGESPRSKNRESVMQCARQLGYIRNQQAANLRTGRSRLIGVMVPFIDNPFYTKFLQEMHNSLGRCSYQSLIACSFGKAETMVEALQLFETYNVDGIVIDVSEGLLTSDIHGMLHQLSQRRRPVVITGAQFHDFDFDHLYLDNKRAIAKVVSHLKSRGHQKVGFLGGLPTNLNIKNRLAGFQEALTANGQKTNHKWIGLGDPSVPAVQQRALQILSMKDRPSAVVCTSDMIAIVAIKVATELGLKVPADIAITGFDDIDQASLINPGLTTVRQPMPVMTTEIVQMILSPEHPPKRPAEEKCYDAELVIREST